MIFTEESVSSEIEIDPRVESAGRTADAFECYREPHSARIAELADLLAARFNFARNDGLALRQASYLHDAGEVIMDREYISAPRPLARNERLDLYRHPVIGEQEAAKGEHSRAVQLLVRWHHEWWNGSGYPDRLEGERIPLAARILRICDTYSALTSKRPFREAFSPAEADRYVAEAAGIEFDPRVALALLSVPARYREFTEPAVEESPVEKPEADPETAAETPSDVPEAHAPDDV